MGMKHIHIKEFCGIREMVLILALLVACLDNARGDDMADYRDSGVIGEKKTTTGEVTTTHPSGATITSLTGGRKTITPVVNDDVAYFDLNGDYSFHFSCPNWKYKIESFWSNPDANQERTGFSVALIPSQESSFIEVKELDIILQSPLNTEPTTEELNSIQRNGYVESPLQGEERNLAAKQSIQWIINNGLDGYFFNNNEHVEFSVQSLGNKEFIKAELNVLSKGESGTQKCTIWALNERGYRFRNGNNLRRVETWVCLVISNGSDFSDFVSQAKMIPETLEFNSGRNVYSDLKN